jgi:predicted ATPase
MEKIRFVVTDRFVTISKSIKNVVILTWDQWNDYSYYTTFGIYFIDNFGNRLEIGSVRIAYHGQQTGSDQKGLKINDDFEQLEERYFSLGTDDTYYENLKSLGEELREQILISLNDIAFNSDIYERAIREEVTLNSLFRDISFDTATIQYRRIAKGGARLTNYNFTYYFPQTIVSMVPEKIDFNVLAEHNPPTNIQTIIGRNGVGKSHLINGMIDSILTPSEEVKKGKFVINDDRDNEKFSNIICVTFSAFDEFQFHDKPANPEIKYHYIGIRSLKNIEAAKTENMSINFADEFTSSLGLIISSAKKFKWKRVLTILESDPIFKDEQCIKLVDLYDSNNLEPIRENFARLSSGHKIILLTITKLVELSIEKSLIFFDEPETHLHPPLLSSFVRALSELLTDRNAVCIMTTHSPIVLQEVPHSCVYKLSRKGVSAKLERLQLETFGENIGVLTNEIFGLEVTDSGFYRILKELAARYNSYEEALYNIQSQLGVEGRSILRSLFFDKKGV